MLLFFLRIVFSDKIIESKTDRVDDLDLVSPEILNKTNNQKQGPSTLMGIWILVFDFFLRMSELSSSLKEAGGMNKFESGKAVSL